MELEINVVRLSEKIALITGAASGMGLAHAERFVEEGAKVILTDVNADDGHAHAERLGEHAVFFEHDVADESSWAEVVSRSSKAFGPITVLVNNAGILGPVQNTIDLATQDYLKVIAVDQHSVFYGMRAVIPGMLEAGRGSIVNISSLAGIRPVIGSPNLAYVAAKSAIRGMSQWAAVAYGPNRIRVNSVHPGAIRTPMGADAADEESVREVRTRTPLRRAGWPNEVTNLVLFLASDEASYVTGTVQTVDGGYIAQ